MKLYNTAMEQQHIGISNQYLLFKRGTSEESCLEIVESRIGRRLHYDLRVRRIDREWIIGCMPGETNLWTLIAAAF